MIQTRAACANWSPVSILPGVGTFRFSALCVAERGNRNGLGLLSDKEAVFPSSAPSEFRQGSAEVGCCNPLSVSRKAQVSDLLLCDVL